eukprot:8352173-Pyramimonas_sp.AAC.4
MDAPGGKCQIRRRLTLQGVTRFSGRKALRSGGSDNLRVGCMHVQPARSTLRSMHRKGASQSL